ncbi:MAG: hypothetical protein ACLPKB_34455 [Xanthobacteraceae bacterium]
MTDTDKIAAAIFTASFLTGKPAGENEYLETYARFIELMDAREKAKNKPIAWTNEMVAEIEASPRRKP